MNKKERIKLLKPYWKKYIELMDAAHEKVRELEFRMETDTGIKGIEFYNNDYSIGIELFTKWKLDESEFE